MRQKVVYWRNLSNHPKTKQKVEYQPPKPKAKTRIVREKRGFSSENYNKLLTIIAILIIVSLFLGIVEYLRRFSLTESFVFATSYFVGILSIGIYAIRFALFSELPRFNKRDEEKRNEERFIEYKPSIPKTVSNPHVSVKPVEPKQEEEKSDEKSQKEEEKSDELQGEERERLKKELKKRGNVFVFKEDLKLTIEDRKKKEEGAIGYSHLYYNEPLEESIKFHDRKEE